MATSSAGVYARVSPSVVFIETQTGTGSGVLIEGGYVITNFHVVWPSEEVQVVFPDGFTVNAPVAAWDPMADIALLGPVEDAPAPPLELHNGESLPIGSELLLVGYPAEAESFPQPSITRGILSRIREWEQLGMTYFQTDAAITGGQSGGAVVNANGEVIGISGFEFSDAGFGLVASAADIAPVAERLIDGQDPLGLNSRFFDGRPGFDFDVDIHNYWDVKTFVVDVSGADEVELEIDGPGDGWLYVSDPFGQTILSVDYEYTGIERGSVELFDENTLFVNVTISTGESSSFDLTSSIALYPFNDPDDGQTIAAGDTVAGSIDHHEDIDWYSIHLQEGETIEISANSLNVDTYLFVDFPYSRNNQVVSDDDSGGGLFGTDSVLIYRALQSGEYYIAVRDAAAYSVGGYYLSVTPAPDGHETVEVPPTPEVVESPFGKMIVYESLSSDFSIQAPMDWIELWPDEGNVYLTLSASTPEDDSLIITEGDFLAAGEGEKSLEEAADEFEFALSQEGLEISSRKEVTTSAGVPAIVSEFTLGNGLFSGLSLLSLQEERFFIYIVYLFPDDTAESVKPLAEYTFDTLLLR